MTWALPKAPEVQFIGFSTGWGSKGEFRTWRKVEVDESYSEAFTLGVPHSAIPGSERAAASIIGVSAPRPGSEGQGQDPRGQGGYFRLSLTLGFAGNMPLGPPATYPLT